MLEDASIELMLYTMVLVVLFAFVMNLILYKPLLGFMEKREKIITDDEEYAKSNLNAIEEYNTEIKNIVAAARDKAMSIKQELNAKYQEKYNQLLTAEKEKYEKKHSEFLQNLMVDKAELEEKLILELDVYKKHFAQSINRL